VNVPVKRITDMLELLDDRGQELIYELILRLLPDDVATPEDIAAHTAALEDYKRGECVKHEDIDWN